MSHGSGGIIQRERVGEMAGHGVFHFSKSAENVRPHRRCKKDPPSARENFLVSPRAPANLPARHHNPWRNPDMAEPTPAPTPPPADMQSLMTQLGYAAPNTTITGSPIGSAAAQK